MIKIITKHNFSAEVGEIEAGVFLEDHNVMCYIACIYKNIQVVSVYKNTYKYFKLKLLS